MMMSVHCLRSMSAWFWKPQKIKTLCPKNKLIFREVKDAHLHFMLKAQVNVKLHELAFYWAIFGGVSGPTQANGWVVANVSTSLTKA